MRSAAAIDQPVAQGGAALPSAAPHSPTARLPVWTAVSPCALINAT